MSEGGLGSESVAGLEPAPRHAHPAQLARRRALVAQLQLLPRQLARCTRTHFVDIQIVYLVNLLSVTFSGEVFHQGSSFSVVHRVGLPALAGAGWPRLLAPLLLGVRVAVLLDPELDVRGAFPEPRPPITLTQLHSKND